MGIDYYKTPFKETLAKIPEQFRKLGVACIDCHNNKDMSLNISRGFTLNAALKDIGTDLGKLSRQEMRSILCAQRRVTYNIIKDQEMKSVGIYFPWQGSKMGGISIENIVKRLRSDSTVLEWKQNVTGFKMPFIRHPEYELFTYNSVHWKAGVDVPVKLDLELKKHLENRGEKKLKFNPSLEIKDPFGVQEIF